MILCQNKHKIVSIEQLYLVKPLLLQDIPSSPIKHSASISSIESSDSLENSSEVLNNQKPIKIRRRSSIPDYKQLETNKTKQNDPISNDRRMTIINHLVDNLHKRLNKLENLYSTLSQNSYKRDLMMKQSVEQIFIDLHIRITNEH